MPLKDFKKNLISTWTGRIDYVAYRFAFCIGFGMYMTSIFKNGEPITVTDVVILVSVYLVMLIGVLILKFLQKDSSE